MSLNIYELALNDRLMRTIKDTKEALQAQRTLNAAGGITKINAASASQVQSVLDIVNNAGGGKVFAENGTYIFTSDLDFRSNIELECESFGGVIFVFVGGAKFSIQGTGVYSTGTVSISKGDAQVVGVGTSWLANLTVGHKIVLGGIPYTIDSIDSDTVLTLSVTYYGPDISGDTYYSAIMLENFSIRNLILANGGGVSNLLDVDYIDLCSFEKMIITGATSDNVSFYRAHRPILDTVISDGAGRDAFNMLECPQINLTRTIATNAVRRGFMLDAVSELVAISSPAQNCGGAGWYSKDSIKQNMIGCEGRGCEYGLYVTGGSGINFDKGAAEESEKDGIKVTGNTTKSRFNENRLRDNGEYGIEIDSGSDKNWAKDNDVENNDSGPTNDNGANNTLTDNKP